MARILSPKKNDPECDLVYTPRTLSKQIIDYFGPVGHILDPCKGDGSFYDQYPVGSQKSFCELQDGLDFFDYQTKVDWIITNPPWSKFKEFLSHSMALSDNIVFLVTINHFMTKARMKLMDTCDFGFKEIVKVDTPKEDWPQSGFQLGAIHIQKNWHGPCQFGSLK